MQNEKQYIINLLENEFLDTKYLYYDIDISYERYPNMNLEDRINYLRGTMFCDNNDDLEISNKEYISESEFYEAVDKILEKEHNYKDNEMFELGVDEAYYGNHIEQINLPFNYYYSRITSFKLVGSKLFREIHKLELLEQILNKKYSHLHAYKNYINPEIYDFKEKLVILADYLIDRDVNECLSIVAADYYISTLRLHSLDYFDDIMEDIIEKYKFSKKIPNELKTAVGINYIKECFEYLREDNKKVANNSSQIKYYNYSNKVIDGIYEQMESLNDKIEDPILRRNNKTNVSYYKKYKKFFSDFDIPKQHINSSIMMGLNAFSKFDFKERAYIILGMILANNKIDTEEEYNHMEYNQFLNIIDKVYLKLNIKDERKIVLAKTGIEYALYDYYEDLILKSGDIFLNSLASRYYGVELFEKSMRFRDLYTIFNNIYPNSFFSWNIDGENTIISSFDWMKNFIDYYYDLRDNDALTLLSVNYYKDFLYREGYKKLDDEMIYNLYQRSKMIPNEFKNTFADKVLRKKSKKKV